MLRFLYKKSVKVFLAGTLSAAVLRILLKILYVDTETGFYMRSNALIYVLAAVMLATAAGVAAFVLLEKNDVDRPLRGNRYLEVASTLFGISVVVTGVPKLLAAFALDPSEPAINRLPTWLLKAENILALVTGAVLLYITFCFLSGANRSGVQGMVALIPVVWHAIAMVDRFISFRQVNTVSDQFIETMYLVCATLFLLANSRCLAGMAKSSRPCVIWGLLTAHFGLVLVAGQASAMMVLGSKITGPTTSQNALILSLSAYSLAVALSLVLFKAKE